MLTAPHFTPPPPQDDNGFRNLAAKFPALQGLADPARISKLNLVQKDMLKKVRVCVQARAARAGT